MIPFDWADYLSLARSLAGEVDDASRRSAISRAYYACFGVAARYAIAHGFPHRVVTHDRVWEWFRQPGIASGRDINELGKRLKERRVAADYRADDPQIARQATAIHGWAEELLALLAALPPGPVTQDPEPPSDR